MKYKSVVKEIRELSWEALGPSDLQKLMFLSYISAIEFAESLRIVIKYYPEDKNVKMMADGELQTDNLVFEDYHNKIGDHADFLGYFLKKINYEPDQQTKNHTAVYLKSCRDFDDQIRIKTIFSREEELSGIFQRMLLAKNWNAPGLQAYRYYLERHISLDSDDGGHHDLIKHFKVDDTILPFYEARLELYKAIPTLFKN